MSKVSTLSGIFVNSSKKNSKGKVHLEQATKV